MPRLPAPHLPTWPVAALTLILGFAVADVTGVRPVGGVVLFLGALWCGLRWRETRGLPVALGLVAWFLALFALSHPLGRLIGSWPAVFTVAALMAFAAWLVVDRTTRPAGLGSAGTHA